MMPYTVAKPSPVPMPTGFVVKNGSNARSRTSGVIPVLVSRTVSTACSPSMRVAIVSDPPRLIASRAFTTKFKRT